tara:strand:- start:26940 stop:29195 length:2256 start_codon:yes stop_codon:yes gene_type:complete
VQLSKTRSKTKTLALWFINNSRVLFWTTIALCLFCLPFLSKIEKDFSHKAFYKDNDPFLARYLDYEKNFGNDDKIVIIATHKSDFLSKTGKESIKQIHQSLQKVKEVVSVQSIYSYPLLKDIDDEIVQSNFLDEDKFDIIQNPDVNSFLITPDSKKVVFYLTLKNYHKEKPNYSIPVDSAKEILKELNLNNIKFAFTGTASLMDAVKKYTVQDLKVIFPLILCVIFLISYILFKNIIVSILTLSLTVITIIITLGLGYFIGIQLSSTTALIPQILLSICILDAIHILSYFALKGTQTGGEKTSLVETIQVNIVPTFLTSLTTSLGFFSLCFSDLKPIQDLGTLCSLGVMIAWFTSFFFLPHAMKKLRHKFYSFNQKLTQFDSRSFVKGIDKNRNKVMVFSTIIFLISFSIAMENEVDSDTLNFFKEGSKVRQDYEYAIKEVGGVKGIELLVKDEDNALTASNIKKLFELEEKLLEEKYITKVQHIGHQLEDIYHLLLPNAEKSLSELNDEEIKELVFTYELAATPDNSPWKWITPDYQKVKVNILWTLSGNASTIKAIKKIKKLAKRLEIDLDITGKTSLVVGVNNYLVKTILSSVTLAIVFLTLLMGYFAKSFRLGLAAMIPNIFPIIFAAGVATLYGIKIHMGSVLVASICLGIAIDDTIHFLYHYYKLRKESNMSEVEAIVEIINSTGKSLISTTLILTSCFVLFIFSNVVVNIEFGVLTTVVLILALICDFTILPAIILNRKSKQSA